MCTKLFQFSWSMQIQFSYFLKHFELWTFKALYLCGNKFLKISKSLDNKSKPFKSYFLFPAKKMTQDCMIEENKFIFNSNFAISINSSFTKLHLRGRKIETSISLWKGKVKIVR